MADFYQTFGLVYLNGEPCVILRKFSSGSLAPGPPLVIQVHLLEHLLQFQQQASDHLNKEAQTQWLRMALIKYHPVSLGWKSRYTLTGSPRLKFTVLVETVVSLDSQGLLPNHMGAPRTLSFEFWD